MKSINRKLSILLIVSLLSVQLTSLWHMAESDFEAHDHGGSVCGFYLYSQAADDEALVFSPVVPQFPVLAHALPGSMSSFYLATETSFNRARAPPVAA